MTSQEILIEAKHIEVKLLNLHQYDRKYFEISKNFKWYECFSGDLVNGIEKAKYVEPPQQYWLNAIRHFLNIQLVADYLAVRFKEYVRINYNSFYRTLFWNIRGGGSAGSLHMSAKAGDTRPLGITLDLYKYGMIIAKLCPDLNGFKVYDTFVHADLRNDFKIYN